MPECAWHPGVETNVSCPECERYMCPKDMVDTPVGYKCRECGRARVTRGGVKPRQLAMGAGAGLGVAIVGGIVLAFVPYFSFWTAIIYGIAVGAATRRGGGGHRTWEFAAIAAAAAILGSLATAALGGWRFNVLAAVVGPIVAAVYVSRFG